MKLLGALRASHRFQSTGNRECRWLANEDRLGVKGGKTEKFGIPRESLRNAWRD